MFETRVLPTLLYGSENWILSDSTLSLFESFQAEIGRRILKLSRFHSRLSINVALRWPTMRARVLITKLGFLCRLLTPHPDPDSDTLAYKLFTTLSLQLLFTK